MLDLRDKLMFCNLTHRLEKPLCQCLRLHGGINHGFRKFLGVSKAFFLQSRQFLSLHLYTLVKQEIHLHRHDKEHHVYARGL